MKDQMVYDFANFGSGDVGSTDFKLITMTDRNGNATEFVYGFNGKVMGPL